MAIHSATKLFLAILTLFLGLWFIKRLNRAIRKMKDKRDMEDSLKTFLNSLVGIIFKAFLLISVASMMGIETTSFIAILGAAGLAVGLALQGSLANFGGGVLILLFKPLKVDDVIEAQGHKGRVKGIQIFNTILLGNDNKTIIIPKGNLSNGAITNFTTDGILRVDRNFGISYDANMQQAREAVLSVLNDHPLILK
jgi:small conductance mechanosensitive channel